MIYGIVDLGSNTIRLSVYRCENGKARLLLNRKVMAGLADYVVKGALSPEGMDAACQALNDHLDLMANLSFSRIHVFATASLRNISNTREAVEYIQAKTGLWVDVLSGAEEGRLSFLGAVRESDHSSGLLIDLGGGSTELVRYREGRILESASIPVGSLSLFSRCVSHLHPTGKERKAIRALVKEQMAQYVPHTPPTRWAVGVGGTVRAACKVADLMLERPHPVQQLTAQELRQLLKRLSHCDREDLHLLLKSAPDRVHTLIPGLLALDTVARAYRLETITVSGSGVREGYLYDRVLKGGDQ